MQDKEYYIIQDNAARRGVDPIAGFRTDYHGHEHIQGHVIAAHTQTTKKSLQSTLVHEKDHVLNYQYFTPDRLFSTPKKDRYTAGVYDTAKAAIIVKKLSKKYKTSLPEVFLEEGRDVRAVLASYDEGTTAYDVYTQEIYDRYHDIVSIWLDIKYHIDAADVSSIAGILEYMQCEYADVLPHIFAPVRKEILSSLQEYLGKVKSIRKYFEHISEKNISRSVAKMMGVSQEVFIGDIDIVSDEGTLGILFHEKIDLLSFYHKQKVHETDEKIISSGTKRDLVAQHDMLHTSDPCAMIDTIIANDANILNAAIFKGSREITAYMVEQKTKRQILSILQKKGDIYDYFQQYKVDHPDGYKALHKIYVPYIKNLIDIAHGVYDASPNLASPLLASLPTELWKYAKEYDFSGK